MPSLPVSTVFEGTAPATKVFRDSASMGRPLIVKIGGREYYIGSPPHEQQWAFIDAAEPEQLFGGAKRGGKSIAGSQKLICLAVAFPGNKLGMFRQDLTDLRESILETFFRVLPKELLLEHHKTNHNIFIRTSREPSVIHYEGLRDVRPDEESAKGKEYGAFYIDEPSEIDVANYRMLRAQLCWVLPDGTRPPYMAMLGCNPEPGWVLDRFQALIDPTEDDDSIRVQTNGQQIFIKSLPRDNPYLPPNWENNAGYDQPKEWIEKYLRGSWKVSAGQVFKELDERIHAVEMPNEEYLRTLSLVASIDHASTGITDMLIEGIDPDGNTISLFEYREKNRTIPQHVAGMQSLMQRAIVLCGKEQVVNVAHKEPNILPEFYAFEYILIDPSTQAKTNQSKNELYSNQDEYLRAGIPTTPAFNVISTGIDIIKQYLVVKPTHLHPIRGILGSPSTFIVKRNCPGLWRDMVGLQKTISERGVVTYVGEDHGLDNKRYILVSRPDPPSRTERDIQVLDSVTQKVLRTHAQWDKKFAKPAVDDNQWFNTGQL